MVVEWDELWDDTTQSLREGQRPWVGRSLCLAHLFRKTILTTFFFGISASPPFLTKITEEVFWVTLLKDLRYQKSIVFTVVGKDNTYKCVFVFHFQESSNN